MKEREARPRLKLTVAALFDYPTAKEILVSFPDDWGFVEALRLGDTPLYIAAMPTNQERPSRDHFRGLGAEVNLELANYRLYKFFQPWPTPNVMVSWDGATRMGRVEGVRNLTVQLQPVGQAQAWFGRTHGVLWECYFHEAGRKSNWQDELAAVWRIVEHDIGAAKFFTHPHDPAFEEGYPDFLRRLGYGPDPDAPAWWSKPTA